LEAGAMGLPCIVTDINGSNEIIKNHVNGLIIKPRDKQALAEAMLYCIDNSEVVKLMASKAREMVISKYDQKIILRALKNEYERLLAK
jgi:Glycosyltransferase